MGCLRDMVTMGVCDGMSQVYGYKRICDGMSQGYGYRIVCDGMSQVYGYKGSM